MLLLMTVLTVSLFALIGAISPGQLDPGLVVILGIVAPLVISVLKQTKFPKAANQAIAVVICLLFALASSALADGGFDRTEFVARFGAIFALAQVIYVTYFGSTAFNRQLEAIGGGGG